MKRRDKSAPIWLFSFVDLAFLLLILFTQLIPESPTSPVDLAELELPRIEPIASASAVAASAPVWQLRVHPLAAASDPDRPRAPFELIEPGAPIGEGREAAARAIDARDLADRLALLRTRSVPRPLLAPHRDARSEDLLVAVSLVERIWQGGRGVTVRPTPPIAAAPPTTSESERR
jgi:hypothetical protein